MPADVYVADIIFFDTMIKQFLAMDAELHGGHAAQVWPVILSLSYKFLAGKSLCESLLILILRGRCNQRRSGVQDFMEVFAGCAALSLEMLQANFHGSAYNIVFDEEHDALSSRGLRLLIDNLSCVKYSG